MRWGDKLPAILLFSQDIQLAKDLQASSRLCVEPLIVYPCSNGRKFAEYGHQHKFAVVLIDEAFHDPNASDWVKKLRAGLSVELGNQKAPVILLGAERDLEGVEKILWQGYADLVAKPVDLSLLLQKIQLALGSARLLKEDLLFSMDVQNPARVSLTTEVIRASEYGAVIRSSRQFQQGETLKLHSAMFGEGDPSVWARVVSSEAASPQGGLSGGAQGAFQQEYESRLAFLGPTRATLTSIRLWLKKQYIDAHESGRDEGTGEAGSDTKTKPDLGAHSSHMKMNVQSSTPGRTTDRTAPGSSGQQKGAS